jgi:hypothetical protein
MGGGTAVHSSGCGSPAQLVEIGGYCAGRKRLVVADLRARVYLALGFGLRTSDQQNRETGHDENGRHLRTSHF